MTDTQTASLQDQIGSFGSNGLEAARQISRLAPRTAILMFTMYSCEQLLKDAQAAGIRDVVSKSNGAAEHLLASLNTICVAA